ncbi:hypothetical protein [Algoriphagus faecimaris]|uniref:hypothetical protein n=1 Tax=Algoriphagus faecimaris TaxID=686796 RepID=UPI00111D7EA0|nr:hypothetical protein [Algoriphagus faecimaris]
MNQFAFNLFGSIYSFFWIDPKEPKGQVAGKLPPSGQRMARSCDIPALFFFHSCNSLSIEKTHYYTISYRIFRVGVLMNFLIDESNQSGGGLPTSKGRYDRLCSPV